MYVFSIDINTAVCARKAFDSLQANKQVEKESSHERSSQITGLPTIPVPSFIAQGPPEPKGWRAGFDMIVGQK